MTQNDWKTDKSLIHGQTDQELVYCMCLYILLKWSKGRHEMLSIVSNVFLLQSEALMWIKVKKNFPGKVNYGLKRL